MKTRFLKFSLIGLAAIAAFSAITMLLWNALLPGIFGLVTINFWQALGLLALARLLFGGFGHGRHFGHWHRHGHGHGFNHLRDKWEKMSPEERDEFIKKRHDYFHGGHFGRGRRGECSFDERFKFDKKEESNKDNE